MTVHNADETDKLVLEHPSSEALRIYLHRLKVFTLVVLIAGMVWMCLYGIGYSIQSIRSASEENKTLPARSASEENKTLPPRSASEAIKTLSAIVYQKTEAFAPTARIPFILVISVIALLISYKWSYRSSKDRYFSLITSITVTLFIGSSLYLLSLDLFSKVFAYVTLGLAAIIVLIANLLPKS